MLGRLCRLTFAPALAVITAVALGWRIAYVLIFRADGITEMPPDWCFSQGGANLLASGHGFIQPLVYAGGVEQAADRPPFYMWMHDGMLLAETMSIFTVALVLWATYRFVEAPSALRAAMIGVACGLDATAPLPARDDPVEATV
jgi:hypothetical protein